MEKKSFSFSYFHRGLAGVEFTNLARELGLCDVRNQLLERGDVNSARVCGEYEAAVRRTIELMGERVLEGEVSNREWIQVRQEEIRTEERVFRILSRRIVPLLSPDWR